MPPSCTLEAPVGTCIFCGDHAKLTAEHLFADWISRSFDSTKPYRLYHENLAGEYREWESGSLDYKARLLCAPCNNVRFSALEERVKRLVEPMMLRGAPTTLTVDDQRALSAWIVKTMIVYNHMWDSADPEHLVYSAAERKTFTDTLSPPWGVLVWIGRFFGNTPEESAPIVGSFAGYDHTRPDLKGVQKYVLTFTLRQFAVQLLALKRFTDDAPPLSYLMHYFEPTRMWRQATHRIWPSLGKNVAWPRDVILTRQAVQALNERYGSDFALWPGEVPIGLNAAFFLKDLGPVASTK